MYDEKNIYLDEIEWKRIAPILIFNIHVLGRPKKLLVIVNPFSGRRTGEKIYKKNVAPLLELAGIQTDVIGECGESQKKEPMSFLVLFLNDRVWDFITIIWWNISTIPEVSSYSPK